MIPKKVTLDNFLSYGEKQEVLFDDSEPLWVIAGPNGVGKSAIFDAITYCLFEQHRNGKHHADKLTRHGCDGFRVSFEFEFRSTTYRICRNRIRNRATQSLEQLHADGEFKPIPNINSGGDITEWITQTLGLNYDTFLASVLLKQGESDKIVSARGTERLNLLKKILGMQKYENLSQYADEQRKQAHDHTDELLRQRVTKGEVTPVQLADAEDKVLRAKDEHDAAVRHLEMARELQLQSVTFRAEEQKRQQSESKLSDYSHLKTAADDLKQKAERCDLLETALPKLRKLAEANKSLSVSETKMVDLQTMADKLRAALAYGDAAVKAKTLGDQRELLKKVDVVRKSLAAISATLDTERDATSISINTLVNSINNINNRLGQLDAEIKRATKQLKSFGDVGATCSLCGQTVTAEHAQRETKRLKDELDTAVFEQDEKQADLKQLQQKLKTEEVAKTKLDQQVKQRETWQTQLDTLQPQTAGLDPSMIDEQLHTLNTVQAEYIKQYGTNVPKVTKADLTEAEQRVRAELEHRIRHEETAKHCRQVLAEKWPADDSTPLEKLSSELDVLKDSDVVEKYGNWLKIEPLHQSLEQQLAEAVQAIAVLPEASRLSEQQAKDLVSHAEDSVKAATAATALAVQEQQALTQQANELKLLIQQVKDAEDDERLKKKLHDLLGKGGLLRELVRDAEVQIVARADESLRALSDGDMSLELIQSDNDTEALQLQVRRPDFAEPTGLDYLSGSQKFRVAISIALAIGQFSSGQDRPLECVIIDEGFGSLDKDGLRATAEELNKLKKHLKRIILVSHQEEFTDNFPAVIQLKRGENGTQLERLYRSR